MSTGAATGIETRRIESVAELQEAIRQAQESGAAVYPCGGAAGAAFGSSPNHEGASLDLTGIDNLIDYPAEDMTITVQAGMRWGRLQEILAEKNQTVPIDCPLQDRATVGGVIAAAANGPRRYGLGGVRDYLIGVTAVDGRGRLFHGGGRVVKNVAGYDFCRLLTGSFGMLGVVVEATFKVLPRPESAAWVLGEVADAAASEALLAKLVHSAAAPVAIEYLDGDALDAWTSAPTIAVRIEGTAAEVEWMRNELPKEMATAGGAATRSIADEDAERLLRDLADFRFAVESPLVLQATMLPSRVAEFVELIKKVDPASSIAAHAGDGVIYAAVSAGDDAMLGVIVKQLRPAALAARGGLVVLRSDNASLTPQARWGPPPAGAAWMRRVKDAFDPAGVLNPGRYWI